MAVKRTIPDDIIRFFTEELRETTYKESKDIVKINKKIESKYIHPLTLFLVVAVFISLISIMGFMDLIRLDKTLVSFTENRGIDIITTVESIAQDNLNYLRQTLREDHGDDTFGPFPTEETFSCKESLVKALVEIARDIDIRWQTEFLTEEHLKIIADRENLSLIAIIDERGDILLQSKEFRQENTFSPSGKEQTIGTLFDKLDRQLGEMGYIALRRKDGSETIIIALDARKLKYWGTKIAVNKVIEEVGWGQGVNYLVVMDLEGKILGQTGEIPEQFREAEILTADILAGKLKVLSRKIDVNGRHSLEVFAPIHLDSRIAGYARISLDRTKATITMKENRNRMFVTMMFITLIGLMSMWALYQNQNRHLARLEEMTKRLQRAERLSALGQLAAGVAHEIRNPLNAISMASQRLQREYAPDDQDKREKFYYITGIIREEIRRLNNIIEEFVTFFRVRRLELKDHIVTDIIVKMIELLQTEALSEEIEIQTLWTSNNIVIPLDKDKFKQAFYNILKNAMESISGPGLITVSVERINEKVYIKIKDTGTGLTSEEVERIFNPDYTTKEKGLGLGLPLAYEIIRGHRGEIHVESEPGVGTVFEIVLPTENK